MTAPFSIWLVTICSTSAANSAGVPSLRGKGTASASDAIERSPADAIETTEGTLQRFTPTIGALVTPDIDESLDDQPAKTRFWNAFKALGPWWAEQPPY